LHKTLRFFPLVTFFIHCSFTISKANFHNLVTVHPTIASGETTHNAKRKKVQSYKLKMPDLASQRLRLENDDATTVFILQHPWIEFIGMDTLNIRIRLLSRREFMEVAPSFCNIFPAFAGVSITRVRVSVKFPILARIINHKQQLQTLLAALVKDLNKFKNLSQVEIVFRLPDSSHSQFENENRFWTLVHANYFYDLEFPNWKLFYTIGAMKRTEVSMGSELESRIRGFWLVRTQDEDARLEIMARMARLDLDAMGRLDLDATTQ
jgi:hypothetical protein